MDSELRGSWATKCVALSFVAIILLGNFWLGYYVLKIPIPQWLVTALDVSGVALFFSGVWFGLTALYMRFSKHDE